MTFDEYEEFFKIDYACTTCRRIGMEPNEFRLVKNFSFFLYNPGCKVCCGTGIQPIPFGELRGQTYEDWKAQPAPLPKASPRRRKRRVR